MLRISGGALGPVAACELEIKPLTVLIGRQGTGKSLVSQVLYFFEELPFLASFIAAESRKRLDAAQVVRAGLDQLRSHERAFGTFANPRVTIEHQKAALSPQRPRSTSPLGFTASAVNRVIKPAKDLRVHVDAILSSAARPVRNAVFFPTERLVISQLRTAIAQRVLSLPITYTLFADWMEIAAGAAPAPSEMSTEAAYVAHRAEQALGGTVVRYRDEWKWRYGPERKQQFDLDMASSGQRANWSIFYLSSALFALRSRRDVAEELTLFVEEPEVHLHPAAQVIVAEVLAFLVRQGFRVVLSTHSLTVVYALNNLLQAHRLGDEWVEGTPDPNLRLNPADVAVYSFGGGAPRSLLDASTGFIDETALGGVSEELAAGMNTIGSHLPAKG